MKELAGSHWGGENPMSKTQDGKGYPELQDPAARRGLD